MSTGFSAVERGKVKIGDTVVVFAQGPRTRSKIASELFAHQRDGVMKVAIRP